MQVFNTYFSTKDDLSIYLNQNSIVNSEKILIQIFTGICYLPYIENLITDIKSLLPSVKIIGSTTDGEILEDKVSQNKTVLSISVFTDTKIQTCSTKLLSNSYETAKHLTKNLKKNSELKLAITFCEGLTTNGQEYVKAFQDYDNKLIIAGGLSADNSQFKDTYVFTEDGVQKSGAVLAAFYNKNLVVNSDYNFNWESIGKTLEITDSKANLVYTIDNVPAAQVYKHYLGDKIYDKLPVTGIEFPLIIKQGGMDVARAALAKNDDDSLLFAGNIHKGAKVQFGFGNVQTIVNNRFDIAKRISQNPCEAIFVYSCTARKSILQDSVSLELDPLNQISPISGFFTHGEIFHDSKNNKNNLLNQTLTTLSISETLEVKTTDIIEKNLHTNEIQIIEALCHLTNISSQELSALNMSLEYTIEDKTNELNIKNKELLKKFNYDELTSLGNRNLLVKEISNDPEKYALISIDINNFKNINDLYGVNNGDRILKQFSQLIKKINEDSHYRVFRISGNEFTILDKKPNQEGNYKTFVQSLLKSIQNDSFYINFNGEQLSIDIPITIGIAHKTKKPIEQAYLALKQAKKEHLKYKIYAHDEKIRKKILNNMKITKIIKDAIKNDEVIVYFQGIFKNDKIHKYETLMRIKYKNEIIDPITFLQIAKQNGDYLDLTKIIIEKSFKIFQNRDEFFSINLSFEDIRNEHIIKFLKDKIQQYGVAKKLIIEILEDETMKSYDVVKKIIIELKELGIKIALDDFGSGYSNFTRILELNVDYIKIDGSIIKHIDIDKNSYIIAQTITEFSKKLGIKTIAEYIHNEAVYKKAKEIGIDEFQGFLLAVPKPLD